LLQIVVLILLFVGFRSGRIKTAGGLKTHGRLMSLMVILNIIGVLTVMIPSFIGGFSTVSAELSTIGFPLTFVHAFFGAIAVVLGITPIFKKFGNVRLWMRFAMAVWLVTLALGFLIYIRYYVIL
jgi:uncharacterized membrane protein YozB (DUF420 family)